METKTKKKVIDFRSDTVTKPTKEMLKFMMSCEFGDDVMQEDPTVKLLEKKVADLFGKEAGLFSNQLACRSHLSEPTHQVLCDFNCHIYQYELGGVSYHSGCSYRPIKPKNEVHLTLEEVKKNVVLKNDWHHSITKLICLENTANGNVFPIDEIKKISEFARENYLKIHLDGARIWNASVASGVELKEYAMYFDTVSACLSKGLGAPVGTVLVGDKVVIEKARRYRKVFGGGWRQAGVLAGMGIFAIDNNWKTMEKDHNNAKYLGDMLEKLGFTIKNTVETNMVFSSSKKAKVSWKEVEEKIKEKGIMIQTRGDNNFVRLVVHFQTTKEDIDHFLGCIREIIGIEERDNEEQVDNLYII